MALTRHVVALDPVGKPTLEDRFETIEEINVVFFVARVSADSVTEAKFNIEWLAPFHLKVSFHKTTNVLFAILVGYSGKVVLSHFLEGQSRKEIFKRRVVVVSDIRLFFRPQSVFQNPVCPQKNRF